LNKKQIRLKIKIKLLMEVLHIPNQVEDRYFLRYATENYEMAAWWFNGEREARRMILTTEGLNFRKYARCEWKCIAFIGMIDWG